MQTLGLDRASLDRPDIELLAQKGDTALKIRLALADGIGHGPLSAVFNSDTKSGAVVKEQSLNVPRAFLNMEDPSPMEATSDEVKASTSTDWTAKLPVTDHVQFFRSTKWTATPLGALQTWSTSLRLAIYMLLADSRPACIFW